MSRGLRAVVIGLLLCCARVVGSPPSRNSSQLISILLGVWPFVTVGKVMARLLYRCAVRESQWVF